MAALSSSERKDIATASQEEAAQWEDTRALPLEDLLAMSVEELQTYLEGLGVEIDLERLEAEVRTAMGPDAVLLDRGTPLSPAQMDALESRIQRAVVSVARSTANQTLGDMRQEAILAGDDRPDDEKYLAWVSVGGGCPDCRDLHGTVFAADAWEGISPRDGNTVCRGNCRCMLVPTGAPAGGEGSKVR